METIISATFMLKTSLCMFSWIVFGLNVVLSQVSDILVKLNPAPDIVKNCLIVPLMRGHHFYKVIYLIVEGMDL